jgi:hypothetical protein
MMKKSLILTAIVVISIFCFSFIVKTKNTNSNQIMLYGIAYGKQCNSEAYMYYTYRLIDADDSYSEKENMQSDLEDWYPNATKIKVSTSKFDYGQSASNMCIIKWTNKSANCYYDVIYVAFGANQQDAYNRAEKQKNSYGGYDVSYQILDQKYW